MKLVQTEKTFDTNAQFTSQDFTIGDVSVVIEILRNKLYRHKVRTLVQEYISNARDATREINSKERIEITLPTTFVPTFKVRDFGPGISPDRMYNVFIKYAASTKRDSNKQTGGFGIGAKSAWSYTESFTIVTFIDGTQRSYVAHIGANNNGRLDYLGEAKTDAPNGTEIQVPVSPKDIQEFKRAAFRAVYFWNDNEQPVFKNLAKDDKVERVQGDTMGNLEVNSKLPDYLGFSSSWDKGIIISIDGIPYLIDSSIIDKVLSLEKLCKTVTGRLIVHVPNGELEVAASREEISDSPFTRNNLEEIAKKSLTIVEAKIKKAFSKVKTPFEHLSVFVSLKDLYNLEAYRKYGDFTVNDKNGIESELFAGVKVESCAMVAGKLDKDNIGKTRRWYRRAFIKAELFDSLYFADGSETALITNYRIKELLTTNATIVVVTKHDNDTGQFDQLKTGLGLKDIKTVAYTKPERKAREAIKIERTKKEFCLWNMNKHNNQATYTTLDSNTDKWLYVERTDTINKNELYNLGNYIEKEGWKVCALSKDAMRRVKGNKNFKPLSEYLKNYKVSKVDIAGLKWPLAKHRELMDKLSGLQGLTDRFLIDMIAEYKSHHTANGLVPQMIKDVIGKVDEVEQFKIDDVALGQELKDRYALLENIYFNHRINPEVVAYINAK